LAAEKDVREFDERKDNRRWVWGAAANYCPVTARESALRMGDLSQAKESGAQH
jgi:hypothetical protein